MIFELIDITNWKKKNEILEELKLKDIFIDERTLRSKIKENNQRYMEHLTDTFIAHSEKGYKATKDKNEILKSIEDNHKRALNMLFEESKIKKAMGEKNNLKLVINERGLFYIDY